jgi:hypothetical protein
MTCQLSAHGRVLLVLWGKPELVDVSNIGETVTKLHAQLGPVIFVARVPKNSQAPDEHVRSAIAKLAPALMPRCASHHTVLEGSGFVVAAKRAVLSTMFLMTGKRHNHHVHATVDEVTAAVPAAYRGDMQEALDAFRAEGLLSRELTHSVPPLSRGA